MKVLAWLAFPLIVTLLAMCWAAWRGRSRGPRRSGGAFASVEDFRRFNDALAAPGPRATPERRRGLGRAPKAEKSAHVGKPSASGPPDPVGTTEPFEATGTGRTGGKLEPPETLATGTHGTETRSTGKLGSAEMFGSTKIAGQGS